MLAVLRYLGQTLRVGDLYQLTVRQIQHDGPRSGARLLLQGAGSSMDFWLYCGDPLTLDEGRIRLHLVKVGSERVKIGIEADGLAIDWPKTKAPALASTATTDPPAGAGRIAAFRAGLRTELSLAWLGLRLWWSCADDEAGGAI